jgi:hypothetical protein
MSWIEVRDEHLEAVARHESAHAAMATLAGAPVISMRIVPLCDDDPYDGNVEVMHQNNPRGWRMRIKSLLGPSVANGEELAPTDARLISEYADKLGLNVEDYDEIVEEVADLAQSSSFKRLQNAYMHAALTISPRLDERTLDGLIPRVLAVDDEIDEVFETERIRRGMAAMKAILSDWHPIRWEDGSICWERTNLDRMPAELVSDPHHEVPEESPATIAASHIDVDEQRAIAEALEDEWELEQRQPAPGRLRVVS